MVIFIIKSFIEIPVFNANSIDPYQLPHSAGSDLNLHSLPVSHLLDTRHNGLIKPSLQFSLFCFFFKSKGTVLDFYC